jgi:hypothetical protein
MRSFLRHEFHKFTLNNPTVDSSLGRSVTIRVISVFLAIVACAIGCCFSNAQEIQSKGEHRD